MKITYVKNKLMQQKNTSDKQIKIFNVQNNNLHKQVPLHHNVFIRSLHHSGSNRNYIFMWRSKQYLFTLTVVPYVNLSRSSHWCWVCCTKKLFPICRVKIFGKYLWWCTFFSNVACWRLETLLKLTSFIGNLKGFFPQVYT